MAESEESKLELTPGGREALDLLLDRIRFDVLRRAAAIATDPSEDRLEITGRDIRAAAEDVGATSITKEARRSPLQRALLVYAALGLLAVVGAAVVLLIQTFARTLDPLTNLAAAAAIAGAAVTTLSAVLVYVLGRATQRAIGAASYQVVAADDFVTRWAQIEEVVRRLAARELGDAADDAPLAQLMGTLSRQGVSATDLRELDLLRDLRNRIVHGRLDRQSERLLGQARPEAERLFGSLSRYAAGGSRSDR